MSGDELERMAEGIIRLRAEIIRRREREGDFPADELTTPQALALRAIVRERPLRMGGLAEVLGVSVATASRTVDALEALGLVERVPDPEDARAVLVEATTSGRQEYATRHRRFVRALEVLMSELSERERAQLAESLETLNRLLSGAPSGSARAG